VTAPSWKRAIGECCNATQTYSKHHQHNENQNARTSITKSDEIVQITSLIWALKWRQHCWRQGFWKLCKQKTFANLRALTLLIMHNFIVFMMTTAHLSILKWVFL